MVNFSAVVEEFLIYFLNSNDKPVNGLIFSAYHQKIQWHLTRLKHPVFPKSFTHNSYTDADDVMFIWKAVRVMFWMCMHEPNINGTNDSFMRN
jgi:hypothetical protein